MAVNYSDLTAGTSVTWKNTGGTYALNGKNLATATARQGDKSGDLLDGTKGFPELLEFSFETKLQAAPTDGVEFALWVGFSSSSTASTDNPGDLGGADAAVSDRDILVQLTFVGSIVMASSITTAGHAQRQDKMLVRPKNRYVIPVIDNNTGQTTTNVDGETVLTMTPWYRRTPIG